jgi:hypothetical protein
MFERDTVELAVAGVLRHDPWVYLREDHTLGG